MTKLHLDWAGASKGKGVYQRESDHETLNIAIPEESGGSGEGFAPRDLLASSAGACLSLTLVSLMDVRKLPVANFSMDTELQKKTENIKLCIIQKSS
ncbi:OsmC-like protein [Atopostipes suicloacalis DSM 15692]|uniref:OsmC-like protein n=1 Tax=Atopostipes suicloacalis DSM 15692 TaxID=1121025 RepID=A0A1M4VQ30_9LACT|nr:OsmC family protein [Atopostipes suicloacalis]SHE71069.1 OsmC-like protein [Atopostipes suicloacalis DSM 15692]